MTQASECWEQLFGRGSEYVSPLFTSDFQLEGLWGGVALFVRKCSCSWREVGTCLDARAHCDSPSLLGEAELVLCPEPQGLVFQVPQLRTSSRGLSLSVTNKQVGEEAGLWSMPMAPTFLQASRPSSCQQVAQLWAPLLPPSGLSERVSPETSPGFGDRSINLNILNLAHFAAIHFNHAKVSCHRTNVRLNLFS